MQKEALLLESWGYTAILKRTQKADDSWEWGIGNWELAHKVFLLHIRCSQSWQLNGTDLTDGMLDGRTNN